MSEGRNTSTGIRTSDSPSPCRKPHAHALGWAFAILAALPLLYLLMVPPVLWMAQIKTHPLDVQYRPRQPEWARQFCKPYSWLMEHTPLHKPLDFYATLIGPKHNPVWKKYEESRLRAEAQRKRTQEFMEKVNELRDRMEQHKLQRALLAAPAGRSPTPEESRLRTDTLQKQNEEIMEKVKELRERMEQNKLQNGLRSPPPSKLPPPPSSPPGSKQRPTPPSRDYLAPPPGLAPKMDHVS